MEANSVTCIVPDTMSLDELAQRLDLSYSTAYRLAVQDKLPVPVIRAGKQYRFSRQAYGALTSAQHDTETTSDKVA